MPLSNLAVYAFAVVLIAAGVYHFINPRFYDPIMPDWFPKPLANAAGGVAEVVIGISHAGTRYPYLRPLRGLRPDGDLSAPTHLGCDESAPGHRATLGSGATVGDSVRVDLLVVVGGSAIGWVIGIQSLIASL